MKLKLWEAVKAMQEGHVVTSPSCEEYKIVAGKINFFDGKRFLESVMRLGNTYLDGWEIVEETFDGMEAARRNAAGKTVKRKDWSGMEWNAGCSLPRYMGASDILATDWIEVRE